MYMCSILQVVQLCPFTFVRLSSFGYCFSSMAEHHSLATSGNTTYAHSSPAVSGSTMQIDSFPATDPPMAEVEVRDSSPKTELVGRMDSEDDQKMLLAVLQFLKRKNLSKAVQALEGETETSSISKFSNMSGGSNSLSTAEVTSLLSAYSTEADPSSYEDNFRMLQQVIESSLDSNKWELSQLLYPVFIHMYLELVYNNHDIKAKAFFSNFSATLEDFHEDDIRELSAVTTKSHMEGNTFVYSLRSNKYVVRLSHESNDLLKRSLQDKNSPIVQNIIKQHLSLEVFEGLPRTKAQIKASAGGLCGEPRHDENKAKVFYGLLKEPDIDIPLEDDDDVGEELPESMSSKSKKKKKKEFLSKKNKADPNAPSASRIPLPELKDADRLERINAAKESLKRVKLGGPDNIAPSVCFYTFTNSFGSVSAIDICDDSSLLAAGFQDSHIRIWSLTPKGLRAVKSATELSLVDKEGEDVFERMMDNYTSVESRTLFGHSGTVYSVSFSPCRTLLVSSSEDGTVRLWSLLTWTNLMVYKGHVWAVWDVKFGPYGHYFASCGQDRVARLWVTDHPQPVRIFAGHFSDVDCIQFHHNSNYIATGSSDRTVRVWDMLTGNCVRVFTGHKKPVMSLAWSPDGRFLASGGTDSQVLMWDIASKVMVAQFNAHTAAVHTLAFSRDGEVLASGGLDNTLKVWNFQQAVLDIDTDDIGMHRGHATLSDRNYLISDFPTKNTPIYHLHFTRRNLLLGVGAFTNT